jgi:tRNA dimethylallyltransferase
VSVADLAAEVLRVMSASKDPGALIAIVGPTASGKTDLAVELCLRTGGEIVSADSVQIYRHFDIGSGKPSASERARAPHHVIDAVDPLDHVDAAGYADLASRAIADIESRGKRPIVCGGTFLWVKALLYGLAEAPRADAAIRARHAALSAASGRPALHAELAAVDGASAARLHPNDFVRVSRALEVFEVTGRPMSEWQAEHGFRTARFASKLFARTQPEGELTARITARARAWLGGGWLDETRDLLARGYRDARPMASVGYREVRAHLEGELPQADLEAAVVRATRIFARRQRTWLNHTDVTWLSDGA